MKVARASASLILIAIAVFASAPAAAADYPDSHAYLGANLGMSRAHIDNDRIAGGLQQAGFTTTGIDDDEKDFGFKLYGGYSFNPYLALEAGYFDLGEFGFTANTSPPGSLKGNMEFKG